MTRLAPLIALVLAGTALAWAVLPVEIQTYPKPFTRQRDRAARRGSRLHEGAEAKIEPVTE